MMGNSLITSLKMLTVVGGIDVSKGFSYAKYNVLCLSCNNVHKMVIQ